VTQRFFGPGLPDFFLVPKREKIYQKTIEYTKYPQNIPNSRKIDQMKVK
jgi:hypothetical protein